MIGFLKRLRRNESGNMLIITAAALPLLVGSAGLAVDTIQWTLWKRQLQRAADSAAIAGVYQRVQGGNAIDVQNAVNRDLSFNQNTGLSLHALFPNIVLPADTATLRQQVQVTLGVQRSLTFSSMFMAQAPVITATARAASVPGTDEYCMGADEPNPTKTGLTFIGNAGIEMNCGGISNTPSSNSAVAKGSSIFKAPVIAAVGGIQQSRNFQVDKYDPYVARMDDPYANVKPKQSDLDSKCPNGGGSSAVLDDGTNMNALDNSGVYCFNSMRVGSNKTLNLKPGTYYINGGDAFIQGNLSGTGVTIVLTNKSTASNATIGQFKVNADANINITAPSGGCTLGTDGCFRGIAVYQDRRAPDSNQTNKINGNSGSKVIGALYFPGQELDYNGTGTTTAICTRFWARRITFSGNSTMTNKFERDCAGAGIDPWEGGRRVRLVA